MSNILRTLKDVWRSSRFTIPQIALSFAFAGINWGFWFWWFRNYSDKLSTPMWWLDLNLILSLALVFSLPIVLSIFGSMLSPVRVIISPLDINIFTIGIFAITLWQNFSNVVNSWEIMPFFGFSVVIPVFMILYISAMMVIAFLFAVMGLFIQNPIAIKFIGLEGSEDDLHKRIFETELPPTQVEKILSSPDIKRAMRLESSENLDDGSILFAGTDVSKFYILVSPKTEGGGSLVSIIGYETDVFGIRKPKDSKLWYEGKCASIIAQFEELKIKLVENKKISPQLAISQLAINKILSPTQGIFYQLSKVSGGIARLIIVAIITGLSIYVLLWNNIIQSPDNAIWLFVTIILPLAGQLIFSRRRKSL